MKVIQNFVEKIIFLEQITVVLIFSGQLASRNCSYLESEFWKPDLLVVADMAKVSKTLAVGTKRTVDRERR